MAAPARQARAAGRSWSWLARAGGAARGRRPHHRLRLGRAARPRAARDLRDAGARRGRRSFSRGSRRWWLWPPVAVGLWFAAWLANGLVQDAAGLVADRRSPASRPPRPPRCVAPAWSIRAGLVVLAALDIVLVWGTTERAAVRRPRSRTSRSPTPRARRCRACSRRRSAPRSWAGSTCSRRRCSASSSPGGRSSAPRWSTGVAAGLWGLLFFVTSEVAATVPVLAGLAFAAADARRSRL